MTCLDVHTLMAAAVRIVPDPTYTSQPSCTVTP